MVSPKPGGAPPVFRQRINTGAGRTAMPVAQLQHTTRPESRGVELHKGLASPDSRGISSMSSMSSISRATAQFIAPAGIVLLICWIALAGYGRDILVARMGPAAYSYLCTFISLLGAWIVAALYVRAANIFDRDANAILDDTHQQQEIKPHTNPHTTYD